MQNAKARVWVFAVALTKICLRHLHLSRNPKVEAVSFQLLTNRREFRSRLRVRSPSSNERVQVFDSVLSQFDVEAQSWHALQRYTCARELVVYTWRRVNVPFAPSRVAFDRPTPLDDAALLTHVDLPVCSNSTQ